MTNTRKIPRKRVVIASANPLFSHGLEKLVARRWDSEGVKIRLTSTLEETLAVMDQWKPNLVIVDYDDRKIHRSEFLSHFVSGEQPMQVMLVSLQASGAVTVYDRRTLTIAQVEDWLSPSWSPETIKPKTDP